MVLIVHKLQLQNVQDSHQLLQQQLIIVMIILVPMDHVIINKVLIHVLH